MSKRGPGDSTLDRMRQADSLAERDRAVAALLAEHAYERIDRIIASRMRQTGIPEHEREDIRNEILLKVVARLDRVLEDASAIASFPDYVAVVAFHTFEDFVRRAHPLRSRLKGRIRYTLGHDRRLAVWETSAGWVCGLSAWRGQEATAVDAAELAVTRRGDDLAAMLVELFRAAGHPLLLDHAVTVIGAAEGIPAREKPQQVHDLAAAPARNIVDELESTEYIASLWKEIRELPLRHRIALLFHARDAAGESVMRLLPLSGAASFSDMAAALEMPAETLAALWPELPLDDLSIAKRLGVERQQVINLRRAARDRLTRRLRGDRTR